MKNILLSLFIFTCGVAAYGQAGIRAAHIDVEIIVEKRKALPKVTVTPVVPSKDSGWIKSLENNIISSVQTGKRLPKGKYTVSVNFLVDKQGNICEVLCEKEPGFKLCDRVTGPVKKSPKLEPVLQTPY